jgi:hypothetical protein
VSAGGANRSDADLEETMERGEATRGRIAALVSGSDSIEIKATIPHKQIEQVLRRFRLEVDTEKQRLIYFFDTPKLELNGIGIIARARRTAGEEHDCTIKLRPIEPDRVSKKWHKYPGFKIETDASEHDMVKSASFTMPVKKGLIKRVAAGKTPIADLFDDAQLLFLLSMAKKKLDYSRVHPLGPLQAHRWKVSDPGCPWPMTIELWERADGAMLMESSIRTRVEQGAFAIGGFMAFLAEVGAERDNAEQAKTRWALEYYSGKLQAGGTIKVAGAGKKK